MGGKSASLSESTCTFGTDNGMGVMQTCRLTSPEGTVGNTFELLQQPLPRFRTSRPLGIGLCQESFQSKWIKNVSQQLLYTAKTPYLLVSPLLSIL